MIEIKIILKEKKAENIFEEYIRTEVSERIEIEQENATLGELQLLDHIKKHLRTNDKYHVIDNTKYRVKDLNELLKEIKESL